MNDNDYVSVKPDQLMEALRACKPLISVSAFKNSLGDEIAFAKSNGYKVSSKGMKDAADPGGIMDIAAVYLFQKPN